MRTDQGQRVAVCLLTYNHANVIESTLASVLDQTLAGFELIVSDDCSTDGTWEIITRMAAGDARIRPLRTPRNLGMPGNANYAVSQTARALIALLHHDDIYRHDLLEKWIGVIERHPEVGFVFNAYGVFGTDDIQARAMPGECIDGDWLLRQRLFATWGCCVRGTAMIRRDAWNEVGGMREQFGLLADIDLWMRLAMRWPVGYVPEPVIAVRQARPSYYPDIYAGKEWSWPRQKFLYDIHGANLKAYLSFDSLADRVYWWRHVWRLNIETAKWLSYAVVRQRPQMVITSDQARTDRDLLWLKGFRGALRLATRLWGT